MDADAYARVLKRLLPPGSLWNLEEGSTLSKLMLAMADELARVDGRSANLVNEWFPDTALELLADWERNLGLPDTCLSQIPDAIVDRQVAAAQKFTTRGGQSRAYLIDLAAKLGYAGATITEYRPLCAGFHAGDTCTDDNWAYTFSMNFPKAQSYLFHAGSTAGERLARWQNPSIECMISRASPAHTIQLFTYS